jgi:hypothetical protein
MPERLCGKQGCGHKESAHFTCEVGSFCQECDPYVPDAWHWEHMFEPEDSIPPMKPAVSE